MIVFVNTFDLLSSADGFEETFARTADFLCSRPGFRTHRLIRSRADPARYLNIAEWDDEDALRAATTLPGFAEHARRLHEFARSDPQFFRPVLERDARPGR